MDASVTGDCEGRGVGFASYRNKNSYGCRDGVTGSTQGVGSGGGDVARETRGCCRGGVIDVDCGGGGRVVDKGKGDCGGGCVWVALLSQGSAVPSQGKLSQL